jgi:hypothetical protein
VRHDRVDMAGSMVWQAFAWAARKERVGLMEASAGLRLASQLGFWTRARECTLPKVTEEGQGLGFGGLCTRE